MNKIEFDESLHKISAMEKKVLKLFLQGQSDPEIASSLYIAEGTVKSHISRICKKFDLSSDENNGCIHRDELIGLFIRYEGAWVTNYLRYRFGYPRWEDPDSNRNVERAGSNFYLELAKNCCDENQVIKLYENAVKSDRADPYAQIYLNNANARKQGNPLRIGVVIAKAGNDFHEFASTQVLRGVADAQTKFNDSGGKNGQLLEIDIRNDGNRILDAEEIAQRFVDDSSILAIVGHHSSESTEAALRIYEPQSLALISPTSSSSKLSGRTFFRTVGSTKAVASKYTQYVREHLKLDKIAIIHHSENEFSETLKNDFESAFVRSGGQITDSFNIVNISLNIVETIRQIKEKSEAVLVISSIATNSVAIAIAVENSNLPQSQKLQLLFTTSLPEVPTLEKGGKALEGAVLVSPCLAESSVYMEEARSRWNQEINWRVVTSHNATQAMITAIESSTVVNRATILAQLEPLNQAVDRASEFELDWLHPDDRTSAEIKYSVWQVRHGRFEEI